MRDSAPIDADNSGGREKEEEETKNELFERVLEVNTRALDLSDKFHSNCRPKL